MNSLKYNTLHLINTHASPFVGIYSGFQPLANLKNNNFILVCRAYRDKFIDVKLPTFMKNQSPAIRLKNVVATDRLN